GRRTARPCRLVTRPPGGRVNPGCRPRRRASRGTPSVDAAFDCRRGLMHVPPHAPRVPFHEVYDGDLDLALPDETSDHTRILRNDGGRTPDCPPAPDTCRPPTVSGGSSVVLAEKSPPDRSRMVWHRARGTATTKAEFGEPTTTDGYTLCLYDAGALVSASRVIGACSRTRCWAVTPSRLVFHNKARLPAALERRRR